MTEAATCDPSSRSVARRRFEPPGWLRGRHRQTVLPVLLPAAPLPPAQVRPVAVEPGTAVELHLNRQGTRTEGRRARTAGRGTVLLVHGLAGGVEAPYVLRTAHQALNRGWDVARVNLRSCGGTEALAGTLYHAGQSGDIARVLGALEAEGLPRPYGVIGFSLGGNQALLYAAESGTGCLADAFAAVSPPVDLQATRRAMARPENRLYHLRYTRSLCRLINRIRRHRTVPGPPARWWQIRTVYRFDQLFTVHATPHATVDHYYEAASSGPALSRIARPSLVLTAADDPIVPLASIEHFRTPPGHPLRIETTAGGGHLGFWHRGEPRYWAGEASLDFLEWAGRGRG